MSILVPIRGRLLSATPHVSKKGNQYITILIEKPAKVDDLGYAVGLPTIYKVSVTNGKITLNELHKMIGFNVECNAWINSNKFFSEREGCDDYLTSLSMARIQLYQYVNTPRPSDINNISGSYPNLPKTVIDPYNNLNNKASQGNIFDEENIQSDDLPF